MAGPAAGAGGRGIVPLCGVPAVAACDSVVVVLGSNARAIRAGAEQEFQRLVESGRLHDELQQAHGHGAKELEVEFAINPRWKQGMFSSVRCGLDAALGLRPTAIMLMPVDHPMVQPITVASLAGDAQALAACRRREREQFSMRWFRASRPARHRRSVTRARPRGGRRTRAGELAKPSAATPAWSLPDVHDRGVVNCNTPNERFSTHSITLRGELDAFSEDRRQSFLRPIPAPQRHRASTRAVSDLPAQ
jgi:hypothetical protein